MRWPMRSASSRGFCRCRRHGSGSWFRRPKTRSRPSDDGGAPTWQGGAMNIAARPAETRNAEALIERARSLVPALRQRAAQTQELRKLPDETIADYKRFELLRCLQPTMFGGYGSDYRVFSRM